MFASHQAARGGVTLAAAALAIVCGASSVKAQQFAELPADGLFDYQLHSPYQPAEGVSIVSTDGLESGPVVAGGFNICYLNVFQSQPADKDWWITQHPELVVGGGSVEDPEWAGELIFDISTPEKRATLLQMEIPWIEQCAANGFAAIEPDNIDSFQRAEGVFDASASAAFMQAFAAEAHARSLWVGQKNVAEWAAPTSDGSPNLSTQVGFDFAIVEECIITGECPWLTQQFGPSRVFDIEYWYDEDYTVEGTGTTIPAHTRDHFDSACATLDPGVRVVLRNRDVRGPDPAGGDNGFQYAACIAPNPAGPGTADGEIGVPLPGGETQTGDQDPLPEDTDEP